MTIARFRVRHQRLAVVLGARRGELCALRWSDVDLEAGQVLVAGSVVAVRGQQPTALCAQA